MGCKFHGGVSSTGESKGPDNGRLASNRLFDIQRAQGSLKSKWAMTAGQLEQLTNLMTYSFEPCVDIRADGGSPIHDLHAGYTYLAQLITHDIVPNTDGDVRKVSPALNFDGIYPDSGSSDFGKFIDSDGKFKLCEVCLDKKPFKNRFDFVRDKDVRTGEQVARIVEPRNDQNVILSQLVVLIQLFHNKLVTYQEENKLNQCSKESAYECAKAFVTLLLQKVVTEELLEKIIDPTAYAIWIEKENELRAEGWKFGQGDFSIPEEFSSAFFRVGHTLPRQNYLLNDEAEDEFFGENLFDIFQQNKCLSAKYLVEWPRFFHIDADDIVNTASRIDLNISGGMTVIPDTFDKSEGFLGNSIFRYSKHQSTYRELVHFSENEKVRVFRNTTSVPQKAIKNIIVRDVFSSARLPTGREILDHINDKYPLIADAIKVNTSDYASQVSFQDAGSILRGKYLVIVKDKPELLSIENAPLWLFALREAESLPLKFNLQLNRNDVDHMRLGPITSSIIASVLRQAIEEAELNIYQCSPDIKLGELRELYEDALTEPTRITKWLVSFTLEN